MLLFGLKRKSPGFILPWIIIILVDTVASFVIFMMKSIGSKFEIEPLKVFAICAYFVLNIYFLASVSVHYKDLRRQKKITRQLASGLTLDSSGKSLNLLKLENLTFLLFQMRSPSWILNYIHFQALDRKALKVWKVMILFFIDDQRKCSTGLIDWMLLANVPKILARYLPRQSLSFRPWNAVLVKASQQQRPSIFTDWYESDPPLRDANRPELNRRTSVLKVKGLCWNWFSFHSKLSKGNKVILDSGSRQGL